MISAEISNTAAKALRMMPLTVCNGMSVDLGKMMS
jgi:hypothetical protein